MKYRFTYIFAVFLEKCSQSISRLLLGLRLVPVLEPGGRPLRLRPDSHLPPSEVSRIRIQRLVLLPTSIR
jgi:hypothetical protein